MATKKELLALNAKMAKFLRKLMDYSDARVRVRVPQAEKHYQQAKKLVALATKVR